MRSSSFEWTADDGKALFVHSFTPDDEAPPKALIHIAHGMSEHGARYARVAESLTKRGYWVTAHDHRGHGKTATQDELGFFASSDGWGRVIADLKGILARQRSKHPGVPLALIGHSMGSFMTQQLMYEEGANLKAVVLSSTNGPPSMLARMGLYVARAERARLGEHGKSKILQGLSFDDWNKAFRPNRTTHDWLSRDEAEVDKYIADDRCGFAATTSLWVQLLEALPGLARPENILRIPKRLPIYMLAGTEDPLHEKTKNLRPLLQIYEQAGVSDVTYRVYPGARHELFNETNRDEVIKEMGDWLARKLAI